MSAAPMFTGIIPALVTPFTAEGKVNVECTAQLVAHHINSGCGGFYVCGNTGEGNQMTVEERKEQTAAVMQAVQASSTPVPVLVHVGACPIEDACELARHAKEVGAQGTSSVPASGTVEDITAYFTAVGAATDLPFYVYWVPSGVSEMNAGPFLEMMKDVPNLAGLKYTDKNFFKFQQIMALAPKILGRELNCVTGPDEMMVAGLAMGSHGAIGSTYNISIKLNKAIYDTFKSGDVVKAAELQGQSNDFIEVLLQGCECYTKSGLNIIEGLKAIYTARGMDAGSARAYQLTDENRAALLAAVDALPFVADL